MSKRIANRPSASRSGLSGRLPAVLIDAAASLAYG